MVTLFLATLAASAQTSLSITFWPEGRGTQPVYRATLRCDPAGGTLRNAADACASLRQLGGQAFRPIAKDAACTQVYGGPEEALVTGVYNRRTVWTMFRRRNGCETARFARHRFLFTGAMR